MKRIYLKPTSDVINIEAEQMLAGSIGGEGADYPIEGADLYESDWDSESFDWDNESNSSQNSIIWK